MYAPMDLNDLNEGDIVMLHPDFGSGRKVKAVITEVCEDIKNGRPGVDYYMYNDPEDSRWAYLEQVVCKC